MLGENQLACRTQDTAHLGQRLLDPGNGAKGVRDQNGIHRGVRQRYIFTDQPHHLERDGCIRGADAGALGKFGRRLEAENHLDFLRVVEAEIEPATQPDLENSTARARHDFLALLHDRRLAHRKIENRREDASLVESHRPTLASKGCAEQTELTPVAG